MSEIDRLNDQLDALQDVPKASPDSSGASSEIEPDEQVIDSAEMDELLTEFKNIVKKSPIQSILGAVLLGVLIGKIIR